ncbi:acetylxylan esterase [Terrabacter sp. GCM10028922]|uniref:acetylxylan esterase n=1 Tax=Terrabacter sp. GCM10028922 TaxID=3273428 RepID=UPI00361A005F
MPHTDLPLEELRNYLPPLHVPEDFDAFWQDTLAEAGHQDLDASVTRRTSNLVTVETFDFSFRGWGGHTVNAWLHLPATALRDDTPLPAVLQFQGYNGGRGLPHEYVFWASAGYATLVVDTRGQGSGWAVGNTADPVGSAPSQPGHLTRGIEDPANYYYRRVYVDAVRAFEVLREQPIVDRDRVAVTGGSQGGGISLAVAALAKTPMAVMPDVPFLCDFRRATRIAPGDPYGEIVRYLKAHRDRTARVFGTLSYFDAAVLARKATSPALFSVALMDQTCPPSTVFAAFNSYAGPKEIVVYEYNDHEGGQAFQQTRQAEWLARLRERAMPS